MRISGGRPTKTPTIPIIASVDIVMLSGWYFFLFLLAAQFLNDTEQVEAERAHVIIYLRAAGCVTWIRMLKDNIT